jgi:hypothetical protein
MINGEATNTNSIVFYHYTTSVECFTYRLGRQTPRASKSRGHPAKVVY